MDEIFKAVNKGLIKRTRKPGLIKIIKLENFIKHCNNINGLCKSIVYSMTTEVRDRNTINWNIVFNSCEEPLNYWKDIALYSKKEEIHTFNDLVCINFKIIREYPKDFFIRYPQIKSIILSDLRLIYYE